jgi:hypothetical protein
MTDKFIFDRLTLDMQKKYTGNNFGQEFILRGKAGYHRKGEPSKIIYIFQNKDGVTLAADKDEFLSGYTEVKN